MLKSRIPQIVAELNPRVGVALREGAEAMAEGAKARVPVGAPDVHLRDAIHTERQGILKVYVVAGDDDAWYGHLVEHGTSHSAPRPFLVPAFEEQRSHTIALVAETLATL